MGGKKDLIVQHYSGGAYSSPLVRPVNELEEAMYNEMVKLNKQVKAIKEKLEVSNEK